MSRAYVPARLGDVVAWHSAGAIPAGVTVYPVTDAMRAQSPAADTEELEYVATCQAHEAAVAMVGEERPAVVAIRHEGQATQLAEEVPVRLWAAVFVDDLLWYAVEEVPHLA